tara:strand:+ start:868 stop:1542 length:675 start_codon:yes stop_codon:yes gene_type:complete
MALTQMQLIQSLGEAMAWFERELQWGVPPTELRHLVGRIGELYAALITNGQMATEVNQKGYDVVGGEGERIAVKTTAMMGNSGHVSFNPNTLAVVDRVIILRVNTEEMQIETLLNAPLAEARDFMADENAAGKLSLSLCKLTRPARSTSELKAVRVASHGNYEVRELENGSIEVCRDGLPVPSAKPELRHLASELNLSILNGNGNPYNTRQLGSVVIQALEAGV